MLRTKICQNKQRCQGVTVSASTSAGLCVARVEYLGAVITSLVAAFFLAKAVY